MLSYTMKAQLALMRWGCAFFLRLIAVIFFSTYEPRVSSMPFISPRGVNLAQTHSGGVEPCVGDQRSKSMGHTILEGWSVPAVGLGMFVLVVVSGILSGMVKFCFLSRDI